MNEIGNGFLLMCAKASFDVLSAVTPLTEQRVNPPVDLRNEVAFLLLDQLISVTKSLTDLCQIKNTIDLQVIYRNTQAILALTRVQAELSNKFFYLSINPKDDLELKRRFAFFALKAAHEYKKMWSLINDGELTQSTNPEDVEESLRIDSIISERKQTLLSQDIYNWPSFQSLSQDNQEAALKGKFRSDFILQDYDSALAERLNDCEHRHYKLLGNVGIHSSALLLFTRETEQSNSPPFAGGIACTALFHAAAHLALCGLEGNTHVSQMKNKLGPVSVKLLQVLASRIKQPNYLYVHVK